MPFCNLHNIILQIWNLAQLYIIFEFSNLGSQKEAQKKVHLKDESLVAKI